MRLHMDCLYEPCLTLKNCDMRCIKCGFYLSDDWYYSFSDSAGLISCPVCGSPMANCENGHEYVDLGLSVKWATCNVGASSFDGCGAYYAWGECYEKRRYTEKHYKKNRNAMTRENFNQNCVLDLYYDVAYVAWGGSWRIPTLEEFGELIDDCMWEWKEENGIAGYRISGKKLGYTDSFIFLPAAGQRINTKDFYLGSDGFYWASSYEHYGVSGCLFLIEMK